MNSNIYRQYDSRWKNLPYPTKAYSFGHNGCGCCAVTHCAIEIPKYAKYTPADVRPYMVQFATRGHGTLWDGITKGLEHYGYNVHWKQSDSMNDVFNVLKKSLKRGVLLMGSSRGGSKRILWTTGGHYIAFVDAKFENNDWWFYIKDSGGRVKDGKQDGWFSYKQHLRGDVRNVWICTSLKGQPAPKPTPTPSKPKKGTYTGVIPTPTLKNGSAGDRVKSLQKFLNWYGKYNLAIDGKYGSKTASALKKFQKAEGIASDGIYGKNSHAKAKAYKKVNPR